MCWYVIVPHTILCAIACSITRRCEGIVVIIQVIIVQSHVRGGILVRRGGRGRG